MEFHGPEVRLEAQLQELLQHLIELNSRAAVVVLQICHLLFGSTHLKVLQNNWRDLPQIRNMTVQVLILRNFDFSVFERRQSQFMHRQNPNNYELVGRYFWRYLPHPLWNCHRQRKWRDLWGDFSQRSTKRLFPWRVMVLCRQFQANLLTAKTNQKVKWRLFWGWRFHGMCWLPLEARQQQQEMSSKPFQMGAPSEDRSSKLSSQMTWQQLTYYIKETLWKSRGRKLWNWRRLLNKTWCCLTQATER